MLYDESCSVYCASKTMLNMAVKLMFNRLQERGYTFRFYHPGWVKTYMSGGKTEIGVYEAEESARAGLPAVYGGCCHGGPSAHDGYPR